MKRIIVVLFVSAAFTFAGCSLVTRFDPEGQPCDADAPQELKCLADAGYSCDARNICTKNKP